MASRWSAWILNFARIPGQGDRLAHDAKIRTDRIRAKVNGSSQGEAAALANPRPVTKRSMSESSVSRPVAVDPNTRTFPNP